MESQPKPETTRPTLASLWIQIQNSYVDALDGRSFVPPTGLTTIFTSPAIAAAVAELLCAAEDCLGLADAIRHSRVDATARPGDYISEKAVS